MSTLQHCRPIKSGRVFVAVGLLALVAFGIPTKLVVDRAKMGYQDDQWTRQEEDAGKAFTWIAKNTPSDSVVILPPWRKDSFYLAQRAQIANWWILRFDHLTEWRERLESIVGDLSAVRDGTEKAKMTQTTHYYNHLTANDIASLSAKYAAEYLVSSSSYNYPVLYEAGTYRVYSLRQGSSPARQR